MGVRESFYHINITCELIKRHWKWCTVRWKGDVIFRTGNGRKSRATGLSSVNALSFLGMFLETWSHIWKLRSLRETMVKQLQSRRMSHTDRKRERKLSVRLTMYIHPPALSAFGCIMARTYFLRESEKFRHRVNSRCDPRYCVYLRIIVKRPSLL